MPLRFRSVVPYTLPGVLALIGWWWYISRKKERLLRHESLEQAPAAVGLRTHPTDGSNGLLEKSSVSLRNETEAPPQTSPKIGSQRPEPENSFQVVQDTEVAPSLELCPEDAISGTLNRDECLPKPGPGTSRDGPLQVSAEGQEPDKDSSPALDKERLKAPSTTDEIPSPRRAATVSCSPFAATPLSDAERPEPEGEVSKQSTSVPPPDEMDIVTPDKGQRASGSVGSLESPPSAQDFHQHILSSALSRSALASTPLPTVQDPTPEQVQVHSGGKDKDQDLDLERLASELITEVISAATQEVLAVSSCQVSDSSCSRGQQESVIAIKQSHPLLAGLPQVGRQSRGSTESIEDIDQGVSNGCSLHSHGVRQVPAAQRGPQLMVSLPAAPEAAPQTASLPAAPGAAPPQVERDAEATLAEDSACSTLHSEDGVSSEDLQNSHTGLTRVTDYSRQATQPRPLVGGPSSEAPADMDEDSMGPGCEAKRHNGTGLRNGGQGTCDVETDQSGGSDVNSMDSVDSGCTMGAGETQSDHTASSSSELVVWEIEVPKHLVGRLIGKQGRYVSFLKQSSGAKIYISTLPYTQEFQICHIEGAQQQVDKALSLIGKKFKDLDLTNLYAPPPPPLTLPSLPMTSWLLLPSGVTVEVIVVNIVSAGHVFVQQHTHPTYHALRSLDQQMVFCYSQPGTPALPSPAEVGVICAAPALDGAWWRAQVISFYKDSSEVEIRYVDYGGYDRVKIDSLRQIRSDFVTLPFQGAEVLLDNVAPLPGEDRFSAGATSALEELTRGVALLAQVSNYDNSTGLPLIHLWNMAGDEIISVNRSLAERGVALWVDGF
ncbi:A kinase (PRKA) anchor protein 1b [Antennarius striatus]|uniref:A kinase (PRKA) anchor protein 1b n=1 Tax=Antennarius striatus TaxID=241820 RepID=UPI0035AEDD29